MMSKLLLDLDDYEFYSGMEWRPTKYPRPARLTQKLREEVFKRDGYACRYCGDTENLACDHIIPASHQGPTELDNLVTACKRCNSRKKDRTPEEAGMELKSL
jgi:5-methylcytosine-specific restriction endonuclease McrA